MSDTIDQRLGQRIHGLRTDRNLTLDGLAQRADVSRAMLSRIERGDSSPTAQLLNKICGGLGITLSALFAQAEAPVSPLSRRPEQAVWRDPDSGYQRRAVSPPGTGSPVDIVEVEFPPGASVAFDNARLPEAGQHIWVLDGTLDLLLDGTEYRLGQGDCLLMRLGVPLVFRNTTQSPVRYAVVLCRTGRP